MQRRTLLRWIVSGMAAWPARGLRLHAQAASLSDAGVRVLRALAPVVLPSALGPAGHDKVVGDFVQWLGAYRGGVERNWGYGQPRRSLTPSIAPANYERQLNDLDARARARGAGFAELPVADRRAVVSAAVESVKSLPGAPNGTHVVTDVMSFYFSGAAATDLVYRTRIGRSSCRGLIGASEKPGAVAGD